jgi:hypothetical protein
MLGIVAAALGYFLRGKEQETPAPTAPAQVCCQQHEVCERDNLRAAVTKPIEYYNDEELDRFSGTDANQYTDEAADEFRDVLYTLRPADVSGWLRSLQFRQINLPDTLRDEAFLIVGEQPLQSLAR